MNELKAQREAREKAVREQAEKRMKEVQKRDLDRMVQQEMANQKKDAENRAHRAKMDEID